LRDQVEQMRKTYVPGMPVGQPEETKAAGKSRAEKRKAKRERERADEPASDEPKVGSF